MDRETKERLEALRAGLESWRRTRDRGRIPERFWREAVDLAGRSSVAEVARVLALDPIGLERRRADSHRPARADLPAPARRATPAFVELEWSRATARVGAEIELEDGRGARLCVHVTAGDPSDIATIASLLWRARA
jgi:hypothetical protein